MSNYDASNFDCDYVQCAVCENVIKGGKWFARIKHGACFPLHSAGGSRDNSIALVSLCLTFIPASRWQEALLESEERRSRRAPWGRVPAGPWLLGPACTMQARPFFPRDPVERVSGENRPRVLSKLRPTPAVSPGVPLRLIVTAGGAPFHGWKAPFLGARRAESPRGSVHRSR